MLLSIVYCMFAICRSFVWLVLAANSLSFCFPDKVFISPSLLKDNFVAHRIPDWWLFFFFLFQHCKYCAAFSSWQATFWQELPCASGLIGGFPLVCLWFHAGWWRDNLMSIWWWLLLSLINFLNPRFTWLSILWVLCISAFAYHSLFKLQQQCFKCLFIYFSVHAS